MKKIGIILIVVLCTILNLSCRATDIAVPPAEIRGIVFKSDGETPIKNLPVSVWERTIEKTIYKTQTDDNGLFIVPKYKNGNYFIRVDKIYVDMSVLVARDNKVHQTHELVIVMPSKLPFNAPLVIAPFSSLPAIVSP